MDNNYPIAGKRICSLETEYALVVPPAVLHLETRDVLCERLERAILSEQRWARCNSFGRQSQTSTQARSLVVIREGNFIENGSRVYYDAGHFEWANPETLQPQAVVAYEKAAEQSLVDAARRVNDALQRSSPAFRLMLIKNNIDYQSDASYGCHENYSLRRYDGTGREIGQRLVADLVPFLVTRQIYCGAGRIGMRQGIQPTAAAFQLSQRAEFMEQVESQNSREHRGLLNLRDEPLADQRQWRRLHLILGDSNMSEFATYLKVGATAQVLDLVETNQIRGRWALRDPVKAMRDVSRDWLGTRLTLLNGQTTTALEIQRAYCQAVTGAIANLPPGHFAHHVVEQWQTTLDDIESQRTAVYRRLDWAIKRRCLFDPLLDSQHTDWQELAHWEYVYARTQRVGPPVGDENDPLPWLKGNLPATDFQSLERHARAQRLDWRLYGSRRHLLSKLREMDVRYHDIDPQSGLYGVIAEGAHGVDRIVTQEDIRAARHTPPRDTRAWQRGQIIGLCSDLHIPVEMDWDKVLLTEAHRTYAMSDPFSTDQVDVSQIRHQGARPVRQPPAETVQIRIIGVEDLGKG